MIFKRLPVGAYMANCYIFGDSDTKEVVIIDPGDEADKIFSEINDGGYTVKYIAITHSHFDHVSALSQVKDKYNAQVISNEEEFTVGKHKIEVLKTPGHTTDGVCFKTGNLLFTGDTLFKMSVGRCDFEGGSFEQLENSIKKLYTLADGTVVYPGHGLSTTIESEKKNNPYVRG